MKNKHYPKLGKICPCHDCMMKRKKELENKNHDCKDYVNTLWKWDWKKENYEPVADYCTKCGETIYEY